MNNRIRKWIKTPKAKLMGVLFALVFVSAIVSRSEQSSIHNIILSVIFCVVLDLFFIIRQKNMHQRKQVFPDGAIITGTLLGMILANHTNFWSLLLTCIFAILSKNLLKINKKPIFNPAVLGLFLSAVCFSTGQSWWGSMGDASAPYIGIVLIAGFYIVNKVNKFPQVFSFLGTYFLLMCIAGLAHFPNASGSLQVPFINTLIFFSFFMLTDPPTTPAKYREQVIFGVGVALIGASIYLFHGGLSYLYIGLLTGNTFYFLLKKTEPKKKTASARIGRVGTQMRVGE